MSEIVLVGINHKTAPVEIRECIAFGDEETCETLNRLKNEAVIDEVLLYSTCNRVEVVLVSENPGLAVELTKQAIRRSERISASQLEKVLYVHAGNEAVRHLFRVASSLDSMIVGEPQILGQIKEAYRSATQQKSSGVVINRLLHKSFFVAKRVRTETGIGDHAVSISYAAIELGRKIFNSLEDKPVLLIGAGEMAELAVEHLIRQHVGDIYVANRTFERALELARQFKGTAVGLEEIVETLKTVDIIISSTGSPDYIVRRQQLSGLMRSRRNRPLFFIDIAVPRDIDPDINRMSNIYVYDIDDLKNVIEDNIENRQREAIKGERIIDEAVIRFSQWHSSLNVIPTIKDLRSKLQSIADAELKKTIQALNLSDKQQSAMHRMTQALVNKFLHDPTDLLKRDGCQGGKTTYLDITRKLFRLDDED
jgi:glutamyl-tRNA reductase